MHVYRLDPIDPDHPSWRYSEEKDTVWTTAPTPEAARAQVAARSGFAALSEHGSVSPWQDESVTSCVLEPSMSYPSPGEVIREDGSNVDY